MSFDLIAQVAHDLKNPLACIEGYVTLLMSARLGSPRSEEVLRRILSCTRSAVGTIDDLLESTDGRPEQGLRLERVDLRRAVADAAAPVEVIAAGRGLSIDVELPPLPVWADADAGRIQRALTNLLSNAIKFSSNGGTIRLALRSEHGSALISVTDNGMGIEAKHLPRVFEKFYRVHEGGLGFGLGLHIARTIVEAHGGRAWAQSAGLGHGSAFTLSLPLPAPRETPAEPAGLAWMKSAWAFE